MGILAKITYFRFFKGKIVGSIYFISGISSRRIILVLWAFIAFAFGGKLVIMQFEISITIFRYKDVKGLILLIVRLDDRFSMKELSRCRFFYI